MSVILPIKFHSTIESLEDEFLGIHIMPNCYVERVFYTLIEDEFKEQNRTSKKPVYNYLDELTYEFDFTSINYQEFPLDNWNHIVYSFLNSFYEQDADVFFENIDSFLENTDIDKNTKQFTFRSIIDSIKSSVLELQKIKDKNELNDNQGILVNVYLEIYNLLLQNLHSNKYELFNLHKDSNALEEVSESKKYSVKEIQNTKYYKRLFETGFIQVIEQKYQNPEKIIATLGRSNSFGGFVFDVQKEYFAFCEIIGLIEFIEKDYYYDANKIGCFLADISTFSSEHSSNNFKRNYQAINNPSNKSHYASNDKNLEKVESILENLSKK